MAQSNVATKGRMWGYPRLVLGALGSLLEPFCGHLLPKVDRLCSKLTFEIPLRRALRGTPRSISESGGVLGGRGMQATGVPRP